MSAVMDCRLDCVPGVELCPRCHLFCGAAACREAPLLDLSNRNNESQLTFKLNHSVHVPHECFEHSSLELLLLFCRDRQFITEVLEHDCLGTH